MTKRYPNDILATCVVPWRVDFSFDEDLFRTQVRVLRDRLTSRLYLFGTAGEGYAVSDDQFRQIVSAFYEEMRAPENRPMVGIISLSMQTILDRIEWSAALGIRDFQISFPCWGALNDREVDTFFQQICDRFPQCQFLHYNLARSKRVLTGAEYARLLRAHPNLVAVKFGADDQPTRIEMLTKAPELQFFFTEPGYAMNRDHHECGLLISLAAVKLEFGKAFFNARGQELQRLMKVADKIGKALVETVGATGHMDGAYDKLLIKATLHDFPLRLLPPYSSADDHVLQSFLDRLPELI